MTEPLYNKKLGELGHRLLWWMLAHQEKDAEGTPTGKVGAGWRLLAEKELKTHRPRLWAAEKKLLSAGVITKVPYSKEVTIDGRAFG